MMMDELFMHKKELVDNIYNNTIKQVECIKIADVISLENLIDAREPMVKELIEIDKQLSQKNQLSIEKNDVKIEVDEKLKTINELDKINYKFLSEEYEKIGEKLRGLNKSHQAMTSGYLKAPSQNQGYFIDSKK